MSKNISCLIDRYHIATKRLTTLIHNSRGSDKLKISSADAEVEVLFQEILEVEISTDQRIIRIEFLIEILNEMQDCGTSFNGKLLKCIGTDAAYLNNHTIYNCRSQLRRN